MHPPTDWPPITIQTTHQKELLFFFLFLRKQMYPVTALSFPSCYAGDGTIWISKFVEVRINFTCKRLTPFSSFFYNISFSIWELANGSLKALEVYQLPGMKLAVGCGSEDLGGGWIWFSWTCPRPDLFLLHYSEKWKLSIKLSRVLKHKCC